MKNKIMDNHKLYSIHDIVKAHIIGQESFYISDKGNNIKIEASIVSNGGIYFKIDCSQKHLINSKIDMVAKLFLYSATQVTEVIAFIKYISTMFEQSLSIEPLDKLEYFIKNGLEEGQMIKYEKLFKKYATPFHPELFDLDYFKEQLILGILNHSKKLPVYSGDIDFNMMMILRMLDDEDMLRYSGEGYKHRVDFIESPKAILHRIYKIMNAD